MTREIALLVAAHKSAPMPNDSGYLPVHVGRALSDIDLGYQGDDDGENISRLNRSYCELTAAYWAWKNLDADVVGLSHYRRFFVGTGMGPGNSKILSSEDLRKALADTDVIIGTHRHYVIETIESHYRNGHHGSDLDVLRRVVAERGSDYLEAYDRVFGGRSLSLYNMFIMRRPQFDAYAQWLFDILGEVAESIDNDGRSSYQQRTFGYLGERLLNVWVEAHQSDLRVRRSRIVNTEGEPKLRKGLSLITRKLKRDRL